MKSLKLKTSKLVVLIAALAQLIASVAQLVSALQPSP